MKRQKNKNFGNNQRTHSIWCQDIMKTYYEIYNQECSMDKRMAVEHNGTEQSLRQSPSNVSILFCHTCTNNSVENGKSTGTIGHQYAIKGNCAIFKHLLKIDDRLNLNSKL